MLYKNRYNEYSASRRNQEKDEMEHNEQQQQQQLRQSQQHQLQQQQHQSLQNLRQRRPPSQPCSSRRRLMQILVAVSGVPVPETVLAPPWHRHQGSQCGKSYTTAADDSSTNSCTSCSNSCQGLVRLVFVIKATANIDARASVGPPGQALHFEG